MMTKEKLENIIKNLIEFNTQLEFSYLDPSSIETEEDCYSLYYSGNRSFRLRFSKGLLFYSNNWSELKADYSLEVVDSNREEVITEICKLLNNDISGLIKPALINIGGDGEYEDLKYFSRDEEKFKKFIAEVKRLQQ